FHSGALDARRRGLFDGFLFTFGRSLLALLTTGGFTELTRFTSEFTAPTRFARLSPERLLLCGLAAPEYRHKDSGLFFGLPSQLRWRRIALTLLFPDVCDALLNIARRLWIRLGLLQYLSGLVELERALITIGYS